MFSPEIISTQTTEKIQKVAFIHLYMYECIYANIIKIKRKKAFILKVVEKSGRGSREEREGQK